ncbi:MAG: L,D-transpeptidase [Tunicatimonas sp.]
MREPDATHFSAVSRSISVKEYFPFIDSVVAAYDTRVPYPLTEHLLVRANPWIIDTLVNTDYYHRRDRGRFVHNQPALPVLRPGDTIRIPTKAEAYAIQRQLNRTVLDVNIPEFVLRIWIGDSVRHAFPVRVGQNKQRYLETAGRIVDLRTPVGDGKIVRIERDPYFVDPVSGERFFTTKRDDGIRTQMPQIPWLEPEINGLRYGTMIHPTTNPSTLGKAYSNGCVGTPEGAAWMIYYHAPVGTKVRFRYDREVTNERGDTLLLPDIYPLPPREPGSAAAGSFVRYDPVGPSQTATMARCLCR